MKILRKLVLITVFPGLLIYGAYLMKCRLGIDVDEYHRAGDYIAAIARPQRFAAAAKPLSQTEVTPFEARESPSTTGKITVDLTKEKGAANQKVYGNNLLGHEGAKAADYGYGLWDGKRGGIQEEPLQLAKEAGITMVRFPGGCGSHDYDWKQAVGKDRTIFGFGIDEFLQVAEAMTSTIDLKDFTPASKGNAWVLSGPSVDATNEKKHDNVKVTQHEFEIKENPFEFTFEPHSLTAIEIGSSLK